MAGLGSWPHCDSARLRILKRRRNTQRRAATQRRQVAPQDGLVTGQMLVPRRREAGAGSARPQVGRWRWAVHAGGADPSALMSRAAGPQTPVSGLHTAGGSGRRGGRASKGRRKSRRGLGLPAPPSPRCPRTRGDRARPGSGGRDCWPRSEFINRGKHQGCPCTSSKAGRHRPWRNRHPGPRREGSEIRWAWVQSLVTHTSVPHPRAGPWVSPFAHRE